MSAFGKTQSKQEDLEMFSCDKCGATFDDGIDAGHHEASHELVARIIVVLRDCANLNEAINVVAVAAKTIVEVEPRLRLYRWAR